MTKNQLISICEWKSARSKKHVLLNEEKFIKEITSIAFTTQNERIRIEILNILDGVNWPMASTILHFCHRDPYPILDFRALQALGQKGSKRVNYKFWTEYTEKCRDLSKRNHLDMRTIDMALWQFSKENRKLAKLQLSYA